MKIFNVLCFILLFTLNGFTQTNNKYVQTSKDLLEAIRSEENTDKIAEKIAAFTQDELENGLVNDDQRLAFWINIYNGYILRILNQSPNLYEDRRSFFKEPYIQIAGRKWSFAEIEHGLIRSSQYEYGLGYIKKPFPPKHERKLRVKKNTWQVHFALNCGAKSCPPVSIYDDTTIREQFDQTTQTFLNKFSEYDKEKGIVYISSLFNWFRGDFGGKRGSKKILMKYGITDTTKVDIEYSTYDWTLYLNNFNE